MPRVLPEVVVVAADLLDRRDLRVGIEDGEDVGLELPELRARGQLGFGLRVLAAHPVERALAGDVLEPLVGIGVHRGLLRAGGARGGQHGGEQQSGSAQGHGSGFDMGSPDASTAVRRA